MLSKYMQYMQESRVKSKELDFFQMNQYFFKKIENSHWAEKKTIFSNNYNLIWNNLDNDIDASWERQLKNFISRDNLFHYLGHIDLSWIEVNVDSTALKNIEPPLVKSRPTVFLTFHHFYQILAPLILAQYFGPVSAFAFDEEVEPDKAIRSYLAAMYEGMKLSMNGGHLLKVGGQQSEETRIKVKEILHKKGNVYAALDMVNPLFGKNTKAVLKTSYFETDILIGIISLGIKYNAQFTFPFISLREDGRLKFELFNLTGNTVNEVIDSFRNIFESLILRDFTVWEGASLLSFKDGRFA